MLRCLCVVFVLGYGTDVHADNDAGRYDLIILVDDSSAAASAGLSNTVTETLKTYIGNLPDTAKVGLISFDDLASVEASLAPVTPEHRAALLSAVDGMAFQSQHSNVGAGLERALYELEARSDKTVPRSVVLIQTDTVHTGDAAQDTSFKRWATHVLAASAKEQAIPVFTLTIGDNADQAIAKRLAANTFGAHFHAAEAAQAGPKLSALSQRQFDQLNMTRRMMVADAELSQKQPPAEAGHVASNEEPPVAQKTAHVPVAEDISAIQKLNELTESTPTAGGTASIGAAIDDPLKDAKFLFGREPTQKAVESPVTPDKQQVPTIEKAASASPAGDSQMMKLAAIAILASGIAGVIVFLLKGRLPLFKKSGPVTRETRDPGVYLRDIHGITGQVDYPITERLVRVSRTEGRNSPNVVCVTIPDDVISREHAFIEFVEGVYWVVDPGSNNGTYVNDKRVQGKRKLKSGDKLRFAVYEFSFDVVTERSRTIAPVSRSMESTQVAVAAEAGGVETRVQPSSVPDNQSNETVRVSTGSHANAAAVDKTEVRSAG